MECTKMNCSYNDNGKCGAEYTEAIRAVCPEDGIKHIVNGKVLTFEEWNQSWIDGMKGFSKAYFDLMKGGDKHD